LTRVFVRAFIQGAGQWLAPNRLDPRSADADTGRIVVANDNQWVGSPGAAGFTVYVDGKRAGVAPLGETFTQRVQPGSHVLRVRLWCFLSPRVKLDLSPGGTRRFSADERRATSQPIARSAQRGNYAYTRRLFPFGI
jgi:hypothetical protein